MYTCIAMNLFIAFFPESTPAEVLDTAKVLGTGADAFLLSDNVLLIRNRVDNTQVLSDLLKMSEGIDTPKQAGVIFKLNGSYNGYYYPELWEWLAKARDASPT